MRIKLVVAFLIGALIVKTGMAQQGYEKIQLLAKGSYVATTVYSIPTSGSTGIFSANPKRVDLTCRNNSAFTLYIGTNAATTTLTAIGFPILASETFEIGAMSGELYGIGSGGTVDVRCFEGAIR